MTQEAIFSGFGGQGVLTMGMLLGYAGIIEDKEVTWMPSYGPEMRGGTANCITIISDTSISSPIISTFNTLMALNQPSVDKFEEKVKKTVAKFLPYVEVPYKSWMEKWSEGLQKHFPLENTHR